MKIKPNYMMRKTGGAYVVVPLGKEVTSLSGIIRLNETASELFKLFQKGATREEAVKMLLDEYEVDEATAVASVDAFITDIDKYNIIDK